MPAGPVSDLGLAQRIVETLHEPLLVLDDELRVRRANASFYRTFEIGPDGTEGVLLYELAEGHWNIPELHRRLEKVLDEGEAFEGFEVDRSFPGIGHRVMRLNGRTLTRGESREVLLAIEDVTAERELEAELRRQARELKRSNADLEQFAYAASHDLQEPVRMVSSYLQLLERRYGEELDEEAREFIDYAVDGAERMKALINGLLEYSRVGRKEGSFGPVELDAVVDEALGDLARQVEETGAEVRREPLPTCHGNPDQLRRVFQNLIENALTYHGDAPPRIEIRQEPREDGRAEVVVSDHGPGIPPAVHDRVFRIFHQLEPHGTGRAGSGMGLALCRKVVERHDGEIWVESEPGEGAAFHFTLQLETEETA